MKKYLLSILPVLVLFILIFIGAGLYLYRTVPALPENDLFTSTTTARVASVADSTSTPYIIINERKIYVDIADTDAERVQGLSGRPSLEQNAGLLFVFPSSYFWGFWMKDMKFPIDMIWINELNQVVYIVEDAKPESYPTVFKPEDPARYVLEINAGEAERLGIKRGDSVENLTSVAK